MTDMGWADLAACRGEDIELFYGAEMERQYAKAKRERAALALCRHCPVARECLDDALARGDFHGIKGGSTGEERKAQARRERDRARRKQAAA